MLLYSRLIIILEQQGEQIPWLAKKSASSIGQNRQFRIFMSDAFQQTESFKASLEMEKIYWLTKILLRFTKTWTDEVSSWQVRRQPRLKIFVFSRCYRHTGVVRKICGNARYHQVGDWLRSRVRTINRCHKLNPIFDQFWARNNKKTDHFGSVLSHRFGGPDGYRTRGA